LKFGLKLWSINIDLIDQAIQLIDQKIFDYIELFVIPDTEIFPFLIDVPYIIHIPHHKFGVNIGEKSRKKHNLQRIEESITWANKLNAKYLILHAGHDSMKDARVLLSKVKDSRLLIENMPKVGINDEKMIGYSVKQIEDLIKINDAGVCLDFGHAIKAALSLGEDYKEFVNQFLQFEPKVFHVSDGMLNNEKDEHLNIGEGEYDVEYFIECVQNNHSGLVTLETPRFNNNSLQEDIQNICKIKEMKSFKNFIDRKNCDR